MVIEVDILAVILYTIGIFYHWPPFWLRIWYGS